MRSLLASAVIVSMLLLAGCFETKFKLGSPGDSKMNVGYLGDWEFTNPDANADDEKAELIVRTIDANHYYAEWADLNADGGRKGNVTRMVAFMADVKGVPFAHLRNLSDDGTVAEKNLVMRVELDNGQLLLRNLKEDFFKDKSLASDADFVKLVEANLDNPEMYDPAVMVGKKRAK